MFFDIDRKSLHGSLSAPTQLYAALTLKPGAVKV